VYFSLGLKGHLTLKILGHHIKSKYYVVFTIVKCGLAVDSINNELEVESPNLNFLVFCLISPTYVPKSDVIVV
jgi:hypothetical protein